MVILLRLSERKYPIHVARATVCVPEVKCYSNSIPRFALGFGEEPKSCDRSSDCNHTYRFDTLAGEHGLARGSEM